MCCPFNVLIHDRDPSWLLNMSTSASSSSARCLSSPNHDNIASLTALFHASPFSFPPALLSAQHTSHSSRNVPTCLEALLHLFSTLCRPSTWNPTPFKKSPLPVTSHFNLGPSHLHIYSKTENAKIELKVAKRSMSHTVMQQ